MRSILIGDDLSAARDIMRELVGVLPCTPGEDRSYVNLEFAASSAVLMTGTGFRISSGSGGMIRNYNGTQQRKSSPSREIFFDERHIKQYLPINELLI
jgi:hypothetical protein